MGLTNVTNGGVLLPPRIMLFGTDGIGKSTWASQAPSPIFVPTEDGANRIGVDQFPKAEMWDTPPDWPVEKPLPPSFLGNLRQVVAEKHEYKTLVIDTADWAQALAVTFVTDRDFKSDPVQFADYGRGYKPLMAEWIRFLGALDYIRKQKGMEIILLAHATVKTFKNPDGEDYDRFQSNLIDTPNTSVWAKTKEWVDLLLFANHEVIVTAQDGKTAKGKATMKKGVRTVFASPSATYATKVRAGWSMPEKFPLDQATFRKHIEGSK